MKIWKISTGFELCLFFEFQETARDDEWDTFMKNHCFTGWKGAGCQVLSPLKLIFQNADVVLRRHYVKLLLKKLEINQTYNMQLFTYKHPFYSFERLIAHASSMQYLSTINYLVSKDLCICRTLPQRDSVQLLPSYRPYRLGHTYTFILSYLFTFGRFAAVRINPEKFRKIRANQAHHGKST